VAITTLSSREFNQNRSRIKRVADQGPVIITDRGKPSLVVMKYDDYLKLNEKKGSILERLYMPGVAEIDFEPPPMNLELMIPDFDADVWEDAVDSKQTSGSERAQQAPATR
jgi:prevent-host-death family protein